MKYNKKVTQERNEERKITILNLGIPCVQDLTISIEDHYRKCSLSQANFHDIQLIRASDRYRLKFVQQDSDCSRASRFIKDAKNVLR
jgi:hypothetical protein